MCLEICLVVVFHWPLCLNLRVTFDSAMCVDHQTDSVVKESFFQLCLLTKVKPFLNRNELEMTVHAFIVSY